MASYLGYSKAVIDAALALKSAIGHTHVSSDVTGLDSALSGKVNDTGDTMTGDLTLNNAKVRAGTTTDVLGSSLEIIRNSLQVGRIDNNSGGLRVQAQAGTLQLRGSGNSGISIDSNGVADLAAVPTLAGAPMGMRANAQMLPHMADTAGWARADLFTNDGNDWNFVQIDRIYFYPVWYDGTKSVNGFGVHLRGNVAGSTIRVGLFANRSGMFQPGNVIAQTTFAGDTAGWKQSFITAVAFGNGPGWYWHALQSTHQMDIFCRNKYAHKWLDGENIEKAIRADDPRSRSFAVAGAASAGVFTNNPAVVPDGGAAPVVAVGFA